MNHNVSVKDGTAKCPCGFTVAVVHPAYLARVAHAHVANPSASAADVVAFVGANEGVVIW